MNLTKKLTAVLLVVIMIFCFASCSGSEEENTLDIGTINIGLVSPGNVEESDYSKLHYDCFKSAYSFCGAGDGQVTLEENVTPKDSKAMEAAMTDLVERGCRLIVGTDFGYYDEFVKYAENSAKDTENPIAYFAVIGSYTQNAPKSDNLAVLKIASQESEYLQGVTAGLSTKSGKIAYVADSTFGTLQNTDVNAFVAGVKSVKGDAEIFFVKTDDVKAGIEKATAKGCDIVYSRNYVVNEEEGEMFFNVPESVSSTMTLNKITKDGTEFISGTSYNLDVLYTKVVLNTVNEKFSELSKFTWGIKDGIVDVYPASDATIKKTVDEIKDKIIKGEDVVGKLGNEIAGVTAL